MRGYRTDPPVYFGKPGSLVTLPWPQGGVAKPYERMVSDFTTGAGTHRITSMAGGARPFQLSWNALHSDTYRLLEEYWLGANGTGPWCLIDPSANNLLTANQAAATGVYNDARGWAVGAPTQQGAAMTNANASHFHRARASRSLRWALTGTMATTPVIFASSGYSGWAGIPAVPTLSYAWSFWVKSTGDTSITAAIRLQWLNAAGSQISLSSTAFTINGTFQLVSIIATAPALTAYMVPGLQVTGSSVTTPADVYVDEPLLEQTDRVNDWAAGSGVMPVGVINLTEDVPFDSKFKESPVLTLREAVG